MDNSQFSIFQYQHSDAVHRSTLRKVAAAAFLVLSGWSLLYASNHISGIFIPVGIIALIIGIIIYSAVTRNIMIGPRYLLCGQTIVYYANVVRITLYRNGSVLELHTAKGKAFILESDKFPTGARHEPKITKNKTDKFKKVSKKIVERIEQILPHVEKIGC